MEKSFAEVTVEGADYEIRRPDRKANPRSKRLIFSAKRKIAVYLFPPRKIALNAKKYY